MISATSKNRGHSGNRRWWYLLALAMLLLAMCIVLVIANRIALANHALDIALENTGFPRQQGTISRISSSELVIQDVVAGKNAEVSVGSLTLGYDIAGLLNGRLGTIRIENARLTTSDELLTVFEPAGSDDKTAEATLAPSILPVDKVVFRNLTVLAPDEMTSLQVELNGTIDQTRHGLELEASAIVDSPIGALDIETFATMSPSRKWSVDIDFESKLLEVPQDRAVDLAIRGANGTIKATAEGFSVSEAFISGVLSGRPIVNDRNYPAAHLSFGFENDIGHLHATLGEAGGPTHFQARLSGKRTEREMPIELVTSGHVPAELAANLAPLPFEVGAGMLTFELSMNAILEVPHGETVSPRDLRESSANLRLELSDVTIPGVARDLTVSVPLAASIEADWTTSIAITGPVLISGHRLHSDPSIGPAVPNWLKFIKVGDYKLKIVPAHPDDGAIANLSRPPDSDIMARARGRIEFSGPSGRITTTLDGDARLADTGDPFTLKLSASELSAESLNFGPIAEGRIMGDLAIERLADGATSGTFAAEMSAGSVITEALKADEARVKTKLRFSRTPAQIRIFFDEPTEFGARRVDVPKAMRLDRYQGKLRAQAEGPVVTFTSENVLGPVRLILEDMPIEARFPGKSGSIVRGRHPRLTLTREAADEPLRLRTTGGDLGFPSDGVRVTGMTLDLAMKLDGEAPGMPVGDVTIAAIEITGDKPPIRPVRLSMMTRALSDTRLRISGSANIPGTPAKIAIGGRHDWPTGRGRLSLSMEPIAIGRSGIFLGQLSPLLADNLSWNAGTLGIKGTIDYGNAAPVPRLTTTITDAELAVGGIAMQPVNGAVTISSFAPLRTPRDQAIAVGVVDLGLPLTAMDLRFNLMSQDELEVESLSMRLADGKVASDAFPIDLNTLSGSTDLQVSSVSLARLLEVTTLDGIEATGVLDGRIPLRLSEGNIAIPGGNLRSREAGRLAYNPPVDPSDLASGQESVNIVFRALENFQYEALKLDIQRDFGGETEIGLSVKGANPDLYDGYPIALNINLSGKLAQIVNKSLEGYRVPDEIRKRLAPFQ